MNFSYKLYNSFLLPKSIFFSVLEWYVYFMFCYSIFWILYTQDIIFKCWSQSIVVEDQIYYLHYCSVSPMLFWIPSEILLRLFSSWNFLKCLDPKREIQVKNRKIQCKVKVHMEVKGSEESEVLETVIWRKWWRDRLATINQICPWCPLLFCFVVVATVHNHCVKVDIVCSTVTEFHNILYSVPKYFLLTVPQSLLKSEYRMLFLRYLHTT